MPQVISIGTVTPGHTLPHARACAAQIQPCPFQDHQASICSLSLVKLKLRQAQMLFRTQPHEHLVEPNHMLEMTRLPKTRPKSSKIQFPDI